VTDQSKNPPYPSPSGPPDGETYPGTPVWAEPASVTDAALSGTTVAFRRDGPFTQPPPARPAPPSAPPTGAAPPAPTQGWPLAAAVAAVVALVISGLLGLSKFLASVIALADYKVNKDWSGGAVWWTTSLGPTVAQLLFALVAVGAATMAVLSERGRRPPYVVVLGGALFTCGFALNHIAYQALESIYLR
jgi:hypothetical protein